jgi:hypothetical protein
MIRPKGELYIEIFTSSGQYGSKTHWELTLIKHCQKIRHIWWDLLVLVVIAREN